MVLFHRAYLRWPVLNLGELLVRWRSNLGALLLGMVAGFALLEVGLAVCTDVDIDWFPGKAFLSLDRGKAICFAPGLSVELPLDMRRAKDRKSLVARTRQWFVDGPKMTLDKILDLAPHCVIIDELARELGPAPERLAVVPIFGDSFAFGDGLPDQLTVSAFLSAGDPDRNYPVLARPGSFVSDLPDQVERFEVLARERGWHATEAIYLYNTDDVLVPEFLPAEREAYGRNDGQPGEYGDRRPSGGWEALADHSRAYRIVHRYFEKRKKTQQTLQYYRALYDETVPDDGRQRTREVLRGVDRALRTAGIRLHVVIYPVLFTAADGSYPQQDLHDAVMRWCEKDGLTCHDAALAVLAKGGADDLILHPQDRHPNGEANRRMAAFIRAEVMGSRGGDAR